MIVSIIITIIIIIIIIILIIVPGPAEVIGIGYLFPIAAIWAAFDYWRELGLGFRD